MAVGNWGAGGGKGLTTSPVMGLSGELVMGLSGELSGPASTVNDFPHLRHLAGLPAAASGALPVCAQWGHLMAMGMGSVLLAGEG